MTGARDKVQLIGAIVAMQAPWHDEQYGSSSIVPETANIWKQANCTINGPATEAITGVADGAAFDAFKGVVTATSAGTSVAKTVAGSLAEGTLTSLFGIYSYSKMMVQVGWNMVKGCKGD